MQNKAEVKETLEKTKEDPRKPQTKKDKIINGILLLITIIMIIYTLSYGKSTIWFWMYIIEFLILIVTLSSKDVMPATNRVKNIFSSQSGSPPKIERERFTPFAVKASITSFNTS